MASTALTVASPFLPIVRLRPSSAVVSLSCNRATAYASVVAALLMAYFAPAEANAFAPQFTDCGTGDTCTCWAHAATCTAKAQSHIKQILFNEFIV